LHRFSRILIRLTAVGLVLSWACLALLGLSVMLRPFPTLAPSLAPVSFGGLIGFCLLGPATLLGSIMARCPNCRATVFPVIWDGRALVISGGAKPIAKNVLTVFREGRYKCQVCRRTQSLRRKSHEAAKR
jgi:hypothetical protein